MHHETRLNNDVDAARDSEPQHEVEIVSVFTSEIDPVGRFARDVEKAIADDLAQLVDGWNPPTPEVDDRPRASCLACRQLVLVDLTAIGRGGAPWGEIVGPDEAELEELTEQVAWASLEGDPGEMHPIQWWATPGPHRCDGPEREGSLACWEHCQGDQFPVFPAEPEPDHSISLLVVSPEEIDGRAVFGRLTDGRAIIREGGLS